MTKKNYVLIAGQISDGFVFLQGNPYQALRSVAHNLAIGFAIDNPKFDRKKFLNACGIEMCSKCGGTLPLEQETEWFGKHECQA